jgi:thiamine transporter ThiT
MITSDHEKIAVILSQIVENKGTQHFSVSYQIVCSQVSFFSDIFTLEDAVFQGLSTGVIKFMGNLYFEVEKLEIF